MLFTIIVDKNGKSTGETNPKYELDRIDNEDNKVNIKVFIVFSMVWILMSSKG